MKALIQRSKESKVLINSIVYSSISKGMVILLGIDKNDTMEDLKYLENKIINLRIFDDENGLINYNIKQVDGEILLVSQFTLLADTKNGNRPSFKDAMYYKEAVNLYNKMVADLEKHIVVKTGVFKEDMNVIISNDGPVTIMIDSKNK